MALNFEKIKKGANLDPQAASTVSAKGDLDVTSSDGKLNYHNGTTASPLLTETHSQTISNKNIDQNNSITVKDANFTIIDDADATKIAKVEASSITTGTTRTYTLPDASGEVVLKDNIQTISNKTIDQNNTITVKDANLSVIDDADATKIAKFQASGITTSTTRTYTLPDASGTITLNDNSTTITNKNISRGTNNVNGFTAHAVVVADSGGNAAPGVVPGTVGNILKSDGTDWTSGSASVSNIATKTTTYSILTSDRTILADATGGGFTITLAGASNAGLKVTIKKVDNTSNVVTIARAGSDTIEGATSRTLRYQYESLTLEADGGALHVITDSRLDSNWASYTISSSGWGAAGTYSAQYKKMGDSGVFAGSIRLTTAPSGTFQFSNADFFGNLSLTISTTPGQTDTQIKIGGWEGYKNGVANYSGGIYIDTANSNQIIFQNGLSSTVTATSPAIWANTDSIGWWTDVLPITNWKY